MTTVAVVGASPNEERYSNKAMRLLKEHGYTPVPISPKHDQICDAKAYPTLGELEDEVDTVSVYVAPSRQDAIIEDIVALAPRRVIFNPGAENPAAYERLAAGSVEVVEACTLVLLRTGQFDDGAGGSDTPA